MTISPQQILPEVVRTLRRVEYDSLVARGYFDDERVGLLHGALVMKDPQSPPHASVSQRLNRIFAARVPEERAALRLHSPLAASDDSEPEPDVTLVPPGDYLDVHPTNAFLVVEVSDSSLKKDREIEAGLYAATGIPEYWLVDLRHGVVEVHTEPGAGRYQRVTPCRRGDSIHLVALSDVTVEVDAFLP